MCKNQWLLTMHVPGAHPQWLKEVLGGSGHLYFKQSSFETGDPFKNNPRGDFSHFLGTVDLIPYSAWWERGERPHLSWLRLPQGSFILCPYSSHPPTSDLRNWWSITEAEVNTGCQNEWETKGGQSLGCQVYAYCGEKGSFRDRRCYPQYLRLGVHKDHLCIHCITGSMFLW